MRATLPAASLVFGLAISAPACAEEALIAVATNFAGAAEALATEFAAETGHRIAFTAGATGKLYAQISQGAPFDALLAADEHTPARLEAEGPGMAGTRFPYATGRLVLWSADPGKDLSDPLRALANATHVAIANPDLAPYGRAALETLAHLDLDRDLQGRLVTGENIGQAYSLVATGAADVGIVARSAVLAGGLPGTQWIVPADHHAPIRQDAILLAHGKGNAAAIAFLDYLSSPDAAATIAAFGYGNGG
jgi:molybdate transport system substrate-binding protein